MSQEAVEIFIRFIIDGCKHELQMYLSMDIGNSAWYTFKDGTALYMLWDGRFNLILVTATDLGVAYEAIALDIADMPSSTDIMILSRILIERGTYAKEVS